MTIRFIVDGRVQAKQSFKVGTINGQARKFTPPEMTEYANFVKLCFKLKYRGHSPVIFQDKALAVKITVYIEVPKSRSKKERALCLKGLLKPTVKPDCDNIAKNILDAMSGIVYPDDKQIVALLVQKKYAETSFVEIYVDEIKAE